MGVSEHGIINPGQCLSERRYRGLSLWGSAEGSLEMVTAAMEEIRGEGGTI